MSLGPFDFFAWRRERAGIPDRPPVTLCGLLVPVDVDALECAVNGVPVVCGRAHCETCNRAAAAYFLADPPDDSQTWLCECGAYIEDGFHCRFCGLEPPWGCPCDRCQDGGA